MSDTRSKILDTAERLFGEQGYAATSLRQITAGADVNLAAIHYHFGSKDDLLDAIVVRKAAPVNLERLAMLDRLEAAPGTAAVGDIVKAFLEPAFTKIDKNPGFSKLMGRLYGEGVMPGIVAKHFQDVIARFTAAFDRALRHLSDLERQLRVQFLVGSMAHVMFGMRVSHAHHDQLPDPEMLLHALIAYATAGLQAPASLPLKSEETR